MPGYGIRRSGEGTGLLPWSWAVARLVRSHDYWVATGGEDGAPHVMPVWGVWMEDGLWFSSSRESRRARNLRRRPRCSVATDNPFEPVILEGDAELVDDRRDIERFAAAVNDKYHTGYPVDFFSAAGNVCVRVRPVWAFGLDESDFTGSPTRWRFPSIR